MGGGGQTKLTQNKSKQNYKKKSKCRQKATTTPNIKKVSKDASSIKEQDAIKNKCILTN
jgi:hypothetical protein